MSLLGWPLDSCYQYISTNHLDDIRDHDRMSTESCGDSDGGGSSGNGAVPDLHKMRFVRPLARQRQDDSFQINFLNVLALEGAAAGAAAGAGPKYH